MDLLPLSPDGTPIKNVIASTVAELRPSHTGITRVSIDGLRASLCLASCGAALLAHSSDADYEDEVLLAVESFEMSLQGGIRQFPRFLANHFADIVCAIASAALKNVHSGEHVLSVVHGVVRTYAINYLSADPDLAPELLLELCAPIGEAISSSWPVAAFSSIAPILSELERALGVSEGLVITLGKEAVAISPFLSSFVEGERLERLKARRDAIHDRKNTFGSAELDRVNNAIKALERAWRPADFSAPPRRHDA
jgi:hypothetical protein